ncbi:MAG: BspA family leucine-rich repeat surface protein [Firmicutes bacterium]|nr:BspA family leucine-rich repeat surface protein [Bacillota bacterium]
MKNKYKIILIICVIIGICSILVGSIAYYRIVVEGSIKGSTGNAVFVLKDENSNVWNNKEINLGKVNPGDSGEFTVTMDASGSTVDMYATLELDRGTLPTNLKFYTTSDHKSELHKYYSFLEQNGTNSETLTIYWYWNPYIDDIEDSKFINVDNIEANIRVSAVQISEYATMKNGNGVTSSDRMYFWKDNYRPYIRTINFGSDLSNLPSSCTEENLCFDVTSDGSKKKVYGYLIDSGLNFQVGIDENNNPIYHALYNLYIVSGAPIFAPQDCSLFFAGFNNLVNINYNDNFNTSKVTNMSYMFLPIMPGDWSNVVTLTSSIKNVKPSFLNNKRNDIKTKLLSASSSGADIIFGHYYSSLTELNLSSFNTKNVVNMKYMFAKNNTLISLNLSNFNTINVENLEGLFYKCIGISELNLKSFNTSSVTNMSLMFSGCSSLTSLDLSNFNTSSVTNMSLMFDDCSSLTSLDLSSFNTSNVTNMSFMFLGCSSLTTLNLCGFNTSNVTNMSSMFCDCSSLTSLDLSSFNTSNVTKMSSMFYNCLKLQTQINIMNAGTTSYSGMFNGALTDPSAYVILGYTTDTQSIAEAMKVTASTANQSKITLKQI